MSTPFDEESIKLIEKLEIDYIKIASVSANDRSLIKASEKLLKEKSISAEIIYFPTLKPFDYDLVRTSVKKTKKLISFEELSAHDGLFNLCIKSTIGIKDILVNQIAIKDFIHEYGSFEDLCTFSGLTVENLYKKVILLLAKK